MKDKNMSETSKTFRNFSCVDFINELSSSEISPGAGSVSAFSTALSAGLLSMVSSLTSEKKAYKHVETLMKDVSNRSRQIKDRALLLIDEDVAAFGRYLEAVRLSDQTESEKKIRDAAVESAAKQITSVPFETLGLAAEAAELGELLLDKCLLSAMPDAASSIFQAEAAASGAYLNVMSNLKYIKDHGFAEQTSLEAEKLFSRVREASVRGMKYAIKNC